MLRIGVVGYGTGGQHFHTPFIAPGLDVIANEPAPWGFEPAENWGTLRTADGAVRVPSEQGRYHDYDTAFAAAVAAGNPPPVTAETGAGTLAILDAARQSAATGRSISL